MERFILIHGCQAVNRIDHHQAGNLINHHDAAKVIHDRLPYKKSHLPLFSAGQPQEIAGRNQVRA